MEAYIDLALQVIAQRVGITEAQSKQCATHFCGITEWLDESDLKRFKPVLRIQGSNRLGTAIRSYNNEEGFDVDIVCELQTIPDWWTPKHVKDAVGNTLKKSDLYYDLLEDKSGGKRCWTIQYKDGIHADVLPAVVNDEYVRLMRDTYFDSYDEFGIRITDKTRVPEYYSETDRSKWLLSNPIGFAEWFFAQARAHENKHKMFSRQARASIEPFPKWQEDVLILQKIVRLLKRHRDVMFEGKDKKPISMIITVLAAKAYVQVPAGNMLHTLIVVANSLTSVMDIDQLTWRRKVLNPVNLKEDFTDRWVKDPEREKNFYAWVERLKTDLTEIIASKNKVDFGKKLKEIFGEKAGDDTIIELTRKDQAEWKSNDGAKITTAGVLGTVGTMAAKANTFYGK